MIVNADKDKPILLNVKNILSVHINSTIKSDLSEGWYITADYGNEYNITWTVDSKAEAMETLKKLQNYMAS